MKIRVHRPAPGKPGRDFDHGLLDQHSDRVQVAGERGQTQALGFERDGTAAAERIYHRRYLTIETLSNLRVRLFQDLPIG